MACERCLLELEAAAHALIELKLFQPGSLPEAEDWSLIASKLMAAVRHARLLKEPVQ